MHEKKKRHKRGIKMTLGINRDFIFEKVFAFFLPFLLERKEGRREAIGKNSA